jgi:hypothetical protein
MVSGKLEGILNEAVVALLGNSSGICLSVLRETAENLIHDKLLTQPKFELSTFQIEVVYII